MLGTEQRVLEHLEFPCLVPDDTLFENIRYAMECDTKPLLPVKVHNDLLCVVGNGPSLSKQLKKIKAKQNSGAAVMAFQGSDLVLRKAGIVPDMVALLDPTEDLLGMFEPDKKTAYLLASCVNPKVFDALKGHDVYLWHAAQKNGTLAFVETHFPHKPNVVLGGGATIGMRSFYLGYHMGFRRFKLFGMDGSLGFNGRRHAHKYSGADKVRQFMVSFEGKDYLVMPYLAQQAQNFWHIMRNTFAGQIDVTAEGEGLLPAIVAHMRKLGLCKIIAKDTLCKTNHQ